MYENILLCVFLILLLHWYLTRRRHFQLFKKLGIFGPPPNVFFGNAFEILRKGYIQCQEEWNKKYGKILGYYYGTRPVLLVSDVELLKNILIKDFQKFVDRAPILIENPLKNTNLLNSQGLKWKEMRSIITPSFTTSKMKLMSPIINDAIDELLRKLDEKCKSGETFDAYLLYQKLTLDVIGRTAFGIQTDAQKKEKDPLLDLLNFNFHVPFRLPFLLFSSSFQFIRPLISFIRTIVGIISFRGVNPVQEVLRNVADIINFRQKNTEQKRNDLLQLLIDGKIRKNMKLQTQLLAAGDDENDAKTEKIEENSSSDDLSNTRSLTNQEMRSNALVFLLAGYETTSTALAFCTMVLVNYPDVQEKIRQEVNALLKEETKLDYVSVQKLQYLDATFTEILRIYPPVYSFVSREAIEDVQYGSIRIPKGMAVQVPVYMLHRDPEYWPEPEKFIPERFSPENRKKNNPLAWQPFGAGPRNCVGIRFAQMEVKLALARILHKYKLLPTERTDKYPLQLEPSPTIIRPRYGVPIRVEPCVT